MILVIFVLSLFMPNGSRAVAQSTCTSVELYPGYPGYRGMITGLKGVGDFQCLEVLQQENPTFNRYVEDGENVAAASRLGIHGTFRDWTWENWMEIEVERGQQPHCYSCLLLDPSAYPMSYGATVSPDDPRLIIGMTTGNALESYILEEFGSRSTSTTKEGIVWRVAAAFMWVDFPANAPETLEAVRFLVGEWSGHDVDGDGHFSGLDYGMAFETFSSRGGYVPMTGKETYADQYFQAFTVAYLMTSNGMPGMFGTAQDIAYADAFTACEMEYLDYKTFGHCVVANVAGG
jgi:hypothetical protein